MQFTVTPDKDGMMLSRLLLQLADVQMCIRDRTMRSSGGSNCLSQS